MFEKPFIRKIIERDILFTISWDGRYSGRTQDFSGLADLFRASILDNVEFCDESELRETHALFWTARGYSCTYTDAIEPDLMITTYKATEESVSQHESDLVFEIHRLSTNETRFFRGETEDGELDASKIWRTAMDLSHLHNFVLEGQDCTINGKEYRWDFGDEPIQFFHNKKQTYRDLLKWLNEMSEDELDKNVVIKIDGVHHYLDVYDDVTPAIYGVAQ